MRDFQHFCQFLKAMTVLHFYQRPFMKVGEKRFLLSTVDDVRKALEVYLEVFETTRTGTEQRILSFYHEIVKTKPVWYLSELTYEYNLRNNKKLSSGRIAIILKSLSEIGYVDIDKDAEDKRVNIYRPLMKEEEKSTISHILETETLLKAKMQEGLELWFKNYLTNFSLNYMKNFSEDKWGEAEITIEEASRIILEGFSKENFSFTYTEEKQRYFSDKDLSLEKEKKPEIISIPKTEIIVDNSENWIVKREGNKVICKTGEVMFQCPFCEKQGKPVFFSTEHDLNAHIKVWHGGYPDYNYAR